MPHVVTRPSEPFTVAGGALVVHQVPLGHDNLGWLLQCPTSGRCAVVDGPNAAPYLERIDAEGWELCVVLNTHTHGDHIGVNRALARAGRLDGVRVIGAASHAAELPGLTEPVSDGDVVRVGDAAFDVWLTEGHLDGHLSFVTDGAVFCGDTLFAGGCGYLFDGPPATMHASLQRLASLPGSTRVCCAHEYTSDNLRFAHMVEPTNDRLRQRIDAVRELRAVGASTVPSTIAEERATNPFLRGHVAALQSRVYELMKKTDTTVTQQGDADMFHMIRMLKDSKLHKDLPDIFGVRNPVTPR